MALVNNVPTNSSRLSGCVQAYEVHPYREVEPGAVLAPWVSIDFVDQSHQGGGAAITVGNRSSSSTDPQHCAVIKSFELGRSSGVDVKVLIHDTQGGSFREFMKHLVKDWLCLKEVGLGTLLMKVKFGWAKAYCDGPVINKESEDYFVIVDSVEANFTEGKFIFEIIGHDNSNRAFEGGAEFQIGGEGDKGINVVPALQKLLCDSMAPNVASIVFKVGEESSEKGDEIFKADGNNEKKLGPKTKWVAQGTNKIETARRWLQSCPSKNGLFWIIHYNPNVPGGQLIFSEAAKPNCINQSDEWWERNCLGTYIVNGGNNSPVIEFNPKIRWDFASVVAVGGNFGDLNLNSLETEGAKNPGHECLPRELVDGAGTVTNTNPSDADKDLHGGRAVKEAAINDAQAKKTITMTPEGISADLVIVGDPTFCPPVMAMSLKNISIVLINPFHITANGTSCGDWLASPPCNEILSNKAWRIRAVTHRIEAGVYTTTIQVELDSPGLNLPASQNFGAWNGGWKPIGVCS